MSETWDRLKVTLELLGIEPKKSLGQNFLISDHVITKIINAATAMQAKSIIEVGPGPGALTFHLSKMGIPLELIELDRVMAQYWREQGLPVTEADALQIEWTPWLEKPGPRILVSNLPYQISSSIVVDRSLDDHPLDGMVLMFQKEVAQRIRARQEDDAYGMLSVVAQSFWKTETVSDVGAGDFFPPPKISSRVLAFHQLPSPVQDKRRYFKFVKACFIHPRKLMASNLEQGWNVSKEKVMGALKAKGLSEKARAGELNVKQFVEFYHELS